MAPLMGAAATLTPTLTRSFFLSRRKPPPTQTQTQTPPTQHHHHHPQPHPHPHHQNHRNNDDHHTIAPTTTTGAPTTGTTQLDLATEQVRRVVRETLEFVRAGSPASYDALALEDALKIERRERGRVAWLLMMSAEMKRLMAADGPAPPRGLVLVGPRGSGKAQAVSEGLGSFARSGMVLRQPFGDFMWTARRRLLHHLGDDHRRLSDPVPYFLEELYRGPAKIVVLEEVLVTSVVDAMILRRVFLGLFGRGMGVVLTSSRPPSQWYANGVLSHKLDPFLDAVKHQCDVVRLDGNGLGVVVT